MSPVDAAWQAALAAEQQAAFGYGLLGARVAQADLSLAVACSDAHEQLRDATAAAIHAAGLRPVDPAADYPALYPVRDAAAARRLAVRLEDGCSAAWRYLYLQAASAADNAADRRIRRSAQAALIANAVRAAQWRTLANPAHATTPFPGI